MIDHDSETTNVSVIGAGSWGTTLASIASGRCAEHGGGGTVIWAHEPHVADAINHDHVNPAYLPDIRLPAGLRATTSLVDALTPADIVVMAVPSQHFRSVFRAVVPHLPSGIPVLSVAKGIEQGSLRRMTEIMAEESDHDPALLGVLSGPNIAREVAAGQPSATVIALPDARWAELLQHRFMTPTLRVYTNDDVVGCEISGAVKNVIAIAAGIADGLGYGANTKAALLTRGLAELGRLGTAVGGRPLTFLGLAGNGDLIATCSSPHSRNHRVGRELAAGRSIAKIVEEMHMVAEGVDATPAVLALAGLAGIEMPIATQVADVLAGRRDPAAAVGILMGRPPRPEQDTRTTTVRSSASDRRNPPVSAEEPDAPAYVACVPTTPCAWTAVW